MAIYESRVLTVHIRRSAEAVYGFCAEPANYAKWASGLGDSLAQCDGGWRAHTPHGAISIRFTPRNAFGVLDHYVRSEASAEEVYIPLRVVANGSGCDIQFTLFRQPGMDDATFASDAEWVLRDLRALKALLES